MGTYLIVLSKGFPINAMGETIFTVVLQSCTLHKNNLRNKRFDKSSCRSVGKGVTYTTVVILARWSLFTLDITFIEKRPVFSSELYLTADSNGVSNDQFVLQVFC